jgi:hypothetical protein
MAANIGIRIEQTFEVVHALAERSTARPAGGWMVG